MIVLANTPDVKDIDAQEGFENFADRDAWCERESIQPTLVHIDTLLLLGSQQPNLQADLWRQDGERELLLFGIFFALSLELDDDLLLVDGTVRSSVVLAAGKAPVVLLAIFADKCLICRGHASIRKANERPGNFILPSESSQVLEALLIGSAFMCGVLGSGAVKADAFIFAVLDCGGQTWAGLEAVFSTACLAERAQISPDTDRKMIAPSEVSVRLPNICGRDGALFGELRRARVDALSACAIRVRTVRQVVIWHLVWCLAMG